MSVRPINDISFQCFLDEERLMGSRCIKCGASFLPPRPICVRCGSSQMDWHEFQGVGKLVAFTCIAVVPPAMAAEGYGRNKPYCCGVVELTEGVRVDARIEGVDPNRPETICIGMPMKSRYTYREWKGAKQTCLGFEPAKE